MPKKPLLKETERDVLIRALEANARALLLVAERLKLEASENQYVSLKAASAILGGITSAALRERCKDRRFTYGVHFIDTSDGDRPNYLVKPAALRKYFETDPAERSTV
ncbi:hypothetical protein H6F86_21545 [Phormidium sp. FACHB-592]|uniref:Uncharacterized protein n=1 Tax=Stenomitos frigidus AS-A4 TaxID=2933935 RepID=A0ABV0KFJ3_9CYAN|nr:hypothetical protein [Phormidium sp. FACHB-592]MBD2076420.1 hypothetical protein [Phormidium sp. FACHB-592]